MTNNRYGSDGGDEGWRGQGERDRGTRLPSTGDRAVADGGFDPERFEQVVTAAGVGIGVYDHSGRFAYVNEAYAEALGREPANLLGTPVWEVNAAIDRDRFEEYWDSFDIGETRRTETAHVRLDGTEFPAESHTTAIQAEDSRYHVTTLTDVTGRVEGFRELERQDERLEQFASVISHDLRNPLNVAMGRLRLARDECDSDHLEPVESSLERMEALIDDVLALAREGSRLTDPERISVRKTVTTAWATTGDDSATLDVVDDLGVVESAENRLCELFENVIRNAIEHGGPGVAISVGRLDDGIYVEDDGPGIDPDDREKVFEYGYSTDQDATGFGLAIVEQIVQAHGWTVELTDAESGGARFEFRGMDIE